MRSPSCLSVCVPPLKWGPIRVTTIRKGVTSRSRTSHLVEEEAPFQNTQRSWKE
jgi:hypothetical protein